MTDLRMIIEQELNYKRLNNHLNAHSAIENVSNSNLTGR